MSENLKKKALDWLSRQGYPLEMKVAKKFQENKFNVFSSVLFEDPNTKVGREIDVVATRGILYEPHIILDITFLIECKYSSDKPWILFKSSEQSYYNKKYDFMFRNSSEHAKIILLELENFSNDLKDNFLFSFSDGLHYGAKRAMEEKYNMTYEAIMKVCNAVNARANHINKYNTSLITNLEILFPIIIVQGKLYESYLDDNAEVVLEEIDYGKLYISNPELGSDRFYIDVVSFEFLDNYIHLISPAIDEILDYSKKLDHSRAYIQNKNRT